MDDPELNQPVAIERSAEGDHTVEVFVPVGMATASERPSIARNPAIEIQPDEKACRAAASPQINAATA